MVQCYLFNTPYRTLPSQKCNRLQIAKAKEGKEIQPKEIQGEQRQKHCHQLFILSHLMMLRQAWLLGLHVVKYQPFLQQFIDACGHLLHLQDSQHVPAIATAAAKQCVHQMEQGSDHRHSHINLNSQRDWRPGRCQCCEKLQQWRWSTDHRPEDTFTVRMAPWKPFYRLWKAPLLWPPLGALQHLLLLLVSQPSPCPSQPEGDKSLISALCHGCHMTYKGRAGSSKTYKHHVIHIPS